MKPNKQFVAHEVLVWEALTYAACGHSCRDWSSIIIVVVGHLAISTPTGVCLSPVFIHPVDWFCHNLVVLPSIFYHFSIIIDCDCDFD